MQCPECGNEVKKGVVEVREVGSLTQFFTSAAWFSDEEHKKKFGRKSVNLRLNAEGYYCDECMKVFAVFEEK